VVAFGSRLVGRRDGTGCPVPIVLRHWLGLSVEETGRELGIATGTVKSHSSRGIEKLKSMLASVDEIDPNWAGEHRPSPAARASSKAPGLS